ncbi:MAG: hypothetical protein KF887_09900 [Paracoccaceae bacterium]|nr:MAG: hypothetical protein KF887_09900 [Paracoccaceae bacterium]
MSNPDSFIEEVTEEVRRDRLFALMRRYGWIGILAVLLLVGGTAFSEWRKAQAQSEARMFGDAVLDALDAPTPDARRAALASVPTGDSRERAALVGLLLASDPQGDRAGTLAALDAVATDAALPQVWRDMATLRRVIVAGTDMPAAERRAALDPLAAPGRSLRPLALEQLAYLAVEAGDTDAAITQLRALTTDQEAPAGLRRRAEQMITALGGGRDGV